MDALDHQLRILPGACNQIHPHPADLIDTRVHSRYWGLVYGRLSDVADHFFPNLNPIGRELTIHSLPYTVVGVAESQGSIFGQSLDKFVVAPEKSPLKRLLVQHGTIDAMIIQAPTEAGMREAMESARAVITKRAHLISLGLAQRKSAKAKAASPAAPEKTGTSAPKPS